MNKSKALAIFAGATFFEGIGIFGVASAGTAAQTYVRAITPGSDHIVMVDVIAAVTAPAGCATSTTANNRFALDASTTVGKAMFATVLEAAAVNKKIDIVGSNACDLSPTVESINYLTLYP